MDWEGTELASSIVVRMRAFVNRELVSFNTFLSTSPSHLYMLPKHLLPARLSSLAQFIFYLYRRGLPVIRLDLFD